VPLIIEERPRGAGPRASAWLRGRRFFLAAMLALAEIVAVLVWRPGTMLAMLGSLLVLGIAGWGVIRLRPGVLRDVLWIVALAQVFVTVVPLVIGFSLAIGAIIAIVAVIALAVVAFRYRF
jgi:hypothetical protein